MALVLTPATLSSLAGAVVSLACSYFPGLKTWYASLQPNEKRLVMIVLMLVMALTWAVVLILQGAGWQDVARTALSIFVSAAIGSQAAFLLTPKS